MLAFVLCVQASPVEPALFALAFLAFVHTSWSILLNHFCVQELLRRSLVFSLGCFPLLLVIVQYFWMHHVRWYWYENHRGDCGRVDLSCQCFPRCFASTDLVCYLDKLC